jgi:hypothetical protein|tara:strand:- start:8624 stop:8923 length:300 start_codon:yes stop_codon:yes gene_type:complete
MKQQMFSYFEDAHADWVVVPIEETLEGAQVLFPTVSRMEAIALLVEYVESKDDMNFDNQCPDCGGYDSQMAPVTNKTNLKDGNRRQNRICADCLYEWSQ